MKRLKMLGLAAVAAMAFTAFDASTALAATLEIGGVTQNQTVLFTASLTSSTFTTLSRTDSSLVNTCTESHMEGHTIEPFTVKPEEELTATLDELSFTNCERPITVHKPGLLHIAWESGTTNGTVTSSGAEWTVASPFGALICKTSTGVDFGTLTGAPKSPDPGIHAEIDVNAVLNCGFMMPSAWLKVTYFVTTPTELGVSV